MVFLSATLSVSGVTSPTVGLLIRSLSLWSYCSIGFSLLPVGYLPGFTANLANGMNLIHDYYSTEVNKNKYCFVKVRIMVMKNNCIVAAT